MTAFGRGAARAAWSDLASSFERVRTLFESRQARWRVFGRTAAMMSADDIRGTITAVAVTNAVLAGLPGKLGVGVVICQALELWMAWRIARHVGVPLLEPSQLLRSMATWTGVFLIAVHGMRLAVNGLTTVLSFVPFSPIALAELIATDALGVVYLVGFREMAAGDSFRLRPRALLVARHEAASLVRYQVARVRDLLTTRRLRAVGSRLRAWLRGEAIAPPRTTLDAITAASLASLAAGHHDALAGPVGALFVQSVRDIHPHLAHASLAEMAEFMSAYDEHQLAGVLANLKGRLFERMVEAGENADGDGVFATLHPDRNHPSTDLVIHDTDQGHVFAVSLKGTDDPQDIERALARYPEDAVWTTDEVAQRLTDDPRVVGVGIAHTDLEAVTRSNFEALLEQEPPGHFEVAGAAAAGSGLVAAAQLWPYLVARMRGRIGDTEMQRVAERVLGAACVRGAIHWVAFASVGPLYAWFLLARTCLRLAGDGRRGATAADARE